jgi:hypothetical protein
VCKQPKRPTREGEALALLLLTHGNSVLMVRFPRFILPSFGLSVLSALSPLVLALALPIPVLFCLHLLQAVLQTSLSALVTRTHT